MRVNEIFKAIQGEGKNVGIPTVFLRLSGCNLHCDFCDTKYHIENDNITVNDIANKIKAYRIRDVTVTGGEPLLQREDVFTLLDLMSSRRFHLETNGTIYDNRLSKMSSISVSPKKQSLTSSTLQTLTLLSKLDNTTFKFVYEDNKDTWWERVIQTIDIPSKRVYIMPEGARRREQLQRMPEVIEYCIKKGYNFSPRVHVLAYDHRRGV